MSRAEQKSLLARSAQQSDQAESALQALDELDVMSEMTAEFLATFFVVFFGLGAVYASAIVTVDVVKVDRLLYIGLAYGMAYAAVIYAFSYPRSDTRSYPNIRHVNPAFTILLTAFGKFDFSKCVLYLLSQVIASGLAVMSIYYITPFSTKDVTTIYPLMEGVGAANSWSMEIMTSFVYFTSVLTTTFHHWRDQPSQPSVLSPIGENSPFTNHELNCLLMGCTVLMCSLVGSAISGGYMNPIFALGIGILSDQYEVHAFIGPFIGGAVAFMIVLIFGYHFTPRQPQKSN